MVAKQATPPMRLEMGSARNTPLTANHLGSSNVRGKTMKAFRSREKKTACLALPRAVKVDWPANWRDMNTKPKK